MSQGPGAWVGNIPPSKAFPEDCFGHRVGDGHSLTLCPLWNFCLKTNVKSQHGAIHTTEHPFPPTPDKSSLLEEIRVYKGLLAERLNRRSEELMQKGERWDFPCPRPSSSPPWRPKACRVQSEAPPRLFPGTPSPDHRLDTCHTFPSSMSCSHPQPLLALSASPVPQFLHHLTFLGSLQ